MASSSARLFGNRCRALMAAAKSSAASTATAAAEKTKPKPAAAGILKVHKVSPALSDFLGSTEESRASAMTKVWAYIKSHNLQNPSNKREVFCDDKLKTIFDNQEMVNFQGIAKLLSSHFPKAK